jgi:hypothetical protein
MQRFIARWEEELKAPESSTNSEMFFRETPIEYVRPLLLPPSLRSHPSRPEIESKLERAVNLDFPYNSEKLDWEGAHRRVEAVLAEYGESLPRPEQPAWYEEEDPKIERIVAQAARELIIPIPAESLDLPRSAKPAELAWALLRQGKLGVKAYTIEQALALPLPLHPGLKATEFLTVVMQTPGPRKVLVFYYGDGWRYWIRDLD